MGRVKGKQAAVLAAAAVALGVGRAALADSIVVTPSVSAGAMVNTLVGGGITTSNATYTGAAIAAGTFSGNGNILPFNSGIVLTTGAANGVTGPNTTGSFEVINGTAGDADLGSDTLDAASLEFDFTTTNNVMSFQFVFGSEEYTEFAPSAFNDQFAFFLNGVNIALLPSTNTPITINNVNQATNSQYFTNNTTGLYDTQLDGLVGASIPLFATANVTPGATNHIKIVIADRSDYRYDSAVFLKAGSFVDQKPPDDVVNPVPLPAAAWAGMALMGVTGIGKLRRRSKAAE